MKRSELKKQAKQSLKGNWGISILCLFIGGFVMGALSWTVIGTLIVTGPIAIGLCVYFMTVINNKKAELNDFIKGATTNLDNIIVTGVLVSIFTFLWSLLLIIPGIIKSYSYAMTYYIQFDHPEMSETDAITASREMMKGHKWELFMLDLSFIGWYLLVPLTFGWIMLYVAPYQNATKAAFYLNLKNQQGPEIITEGNN